MGIGGDHLGGVCSAKVVRPVGATSPQLLQVTIREPFQSVLITGAMTPRPPVEASMLIEKLGEELLDGGFRGGMRRSHGRLD